MNAFPISYKGRNSVVWSDETKRITGLDSLVIYKEWCIQKRGGYFQEIIEKHNPKLILCTGITSSIDFIRFFGCDIDTYQDCKDFIIASTNQRKTLVAVVPFFGGANGVNSYEKMERL